MEILKPQRMTQAMHYDERIRRTAVLGAGGKMGSGILLLAAAEMADARLKPENRDKVFELHAIDISSESLQGLHSYLKSQLLRMAEKKTVALRGLYAERTDLVENEDIIRQYVDDAMQIVRFSTRIESAYDAHLVFEAAVEEVSLKVKLLRQIHENSANTPYFLTNTSSIPIAELNELAELKGHILGFHFYNPPAVQRIVEFVAPEGTVPEMVEFSLQLAKKMRKVIVQANDFAGFIGNGYLMRDILYGISQAEALEKEVGFAQAVLTVNKLSQDFLLRPMGIFQLMDYVGIDVCQKIMAVMSDRLNKPEIHSPLIDQLMEQGVRGGQYADGSQKDGILKYEKGKITGVYDVRTREYKKADKLRDAADQYLGPLPARHGPWKSLVRMPEREPWLREYFRELNEMQSQGALLGRAYLGEMSRIGRDLVGEGIARKAEDVNTVMETGFYHVYGLINDYVKD